MRLLLEIRDEDVGMDSKKCEMKKREAARAVLINGKNIALLNVSKEGYHKLPGGGLKGNEGIEDALFRELMEETGCRIKIISKIGKIVEHLTHLGILQTSYCFVAKVIDEGEPRFEQDEKEAGFRLVWTSVGNAVKILESEYPENYQGRFIVKRDAKILEEARKIIDLRYPGSIF